MGGTHPAGSSREEQECKNPQKRCQSTLGRAAIWFLRKPEAPVHHRVPDGVGLKVGGAGTECCREDPRENRVQATRTAQLPRSWAFGHFMVSRILESPETPPRALALSTVPWLLPGTVLQKASGNLSLNSTSNLQQFHRDLEASFQGAGKNHAPILGSVPMASTPVASGLDSLAWHLRPPFPSSSPLNLL